MEKFDDIESLYEHIEENAIEYQFSYEIGDLFRDFIKSKCSSEQPDEKQKAQWEVDFFNFKLVEGELACRFSTTDENGNVVEYPNLEKFTDATYEYLVERLTNTANPLLKAVYSHRA